MSSLSNILLLLFVEKNILFYYSMALFFFYWPVKGICGFSRETVIAVTTNIESMEFRRRQIQTIGYEEHPRAGTTDDVEAFFALVHIFFRKYLHPKTLQVHVAEGGQVGIVHLLCTFSLPRFTSLTFYNMENLTIL